MGRVTGIGGVFFKCKDPVAQRKWYQEQLGLDTDEYGTNFEWRHSSNPDRLGYSQWSPFKNDSEYFDGEFMINYRVDDLNGILESLASNGTELIGEIQEEKFGRFAHVRDPEGIKLELWEPNDEQYKKILDGVTRS